MKRPKFEICSECGSHNFDEGNDSLLIRRCRECGNQWLMPEMLIKREMRRIESLEIDLANARAEIESLRGEHEDSNKKG